MGVAVVVLIMSAVGCTALSVIMFHAFTRRGPWEL